MRVIIKKIGIIAIVFAIILSTFPSPSQAQTTTPLPQSREELQALIQILLARLAELQAQVAARTGQQGYVFTRNLTIGSTGPDVQALQSFLAQKGFMTLPTGTAYGKFGPLTQNALAAFQRSRRITPVAGYFGPTTRGVVNAESATLALVPGSTYGSGGSGNAPTTPRRTGGGGGGGGRSSSNNNDNNTNPGPTGNGECSDGNDNDNDGLTDFPIDPGCASASASEGANPDIDVTYAFKQWPIGSVEDCTGSGTSYTCTPTSNFYNVIYPWVLDTRSGSLNPYMAKAYMDALPEGGRGMFSWVMDAAGYSQGHFYRSADNCVDANGNTLMTTHSGSPIIIDDDGLLVARSGDPAPVRCPWMDDWYSIVQPRWENFFRDYAAIGGKVDVITMDNEMSSHVAGLDWTKAQSIISNPKFSQTNTNFSSDNLARGSMQSKMEGLSTLLSNQTNCEAVNCLTYASLFLYDWFHSYLRGATYEAARQSFPNVAFSNFANTAYDYEEYKLPIYTYTTDCLDGSYCSPGVLIGNYQQPVFMYGPSVYHEGTTFDDIHPYRNTPFSKLRQDAIFLKISRLSNPDSGSAPLYGSAFYTSSMPAGSYAESIFHSLAAGSDYLDSWHDGNPTIQDERALSEAMAEFDQIAGFESKETLMFEDDWLNERLTRANPSAWNDDFILTGIESGGRNVWRFTPETGHLPEIPTAASTLVSSDPPTFQTAQYRITFPEGKIYTPPNPKSTLGYWIVQPAGMEPVITEGSALNVPPIANYWVYYSNQAIGYVVFNGSTSQDPDGPSVTFEYDFNGDGDYSDPIRLFDGTEIPLSSALSPGWFYYRYETPGTKTVGLKITDTDGASVIYRRSFTIPDALCNQSLCNIPTVTASSEVSSSNLAQVYNAFITPINSFWRSAAALTLAPFFQLLHLFR